MYFDYAIAAIKVTYSKSPNFRLFFQVLHVDVFETSGQNKNKHQNFFIFNNFYKNQRGMYVKLH